MNFAHEENYVANRILIWEFHQEGMEGRTQTVCSSAPEVQFFRAAVAMELWIYSAVSEKISSSVRILEPHCSNRSIELFCRCTVTMALQTSAGNCESYNG